MQAIILLGGKGTRLSALYPDRPKALAPVAGRPFLVWQLEWLARGGVTDVHLAAGHLASVLQSQLSTLQSQVSGPTPHVSSLTLSVEPEPLGTGGGLKFVEPFIRSDPFLVLNGDSLLPRLDFQSLEKAHAGFSNHWTTIAVTRMESAGRYGTVEFDAAQRVTAFREKAERQGGWVNGGVYLMDRCALALMEPGKNLSIETDVFPEMARQGRLRVCSCPGPLLDMGTPDGLAALEAFLSAGA